MINGKKMLAALALASILMMLTAAVWLIAGAGAPTLSIAGCYQSMPFLLGSGIAGPPGIAYSMPSWAPEPPCYVPSLPLYFNAHGWGFPLTLGNARIGLIPTIC